MVEMSTSAVLRRSVMSLSRMAAILATCVSSTVKVGLMPTTVLPSTVPTVIVGCATSQVSTLAKGDVLKQ